ncbi:MAG: MBL fold metallo-hydrolase, partial [Planctomycetes bacterium]|nr:MBL fold metallo-hydrolase [Planctomycetota bacterium]
RVSLAAWLGASIPLVWSQPDCTPLAPLFSLALTPIVGALLAVGFVDAVILVGVGSPLPGIAALCKGTGSVFVALLESIGRAFDACPGTPMLWPPLPAVTIALLLVSVTIVWAKRRVTSAALATALGAAVVAVPPTETPSLSLPSLGRGQSLIVAGDRATVLFDAGSVDLPLGGSREIVRCLWAKGRTHIDLLILSHAHADHVLAAPDLERQLSIGAIAVGPRFDESDLGRALVERWRRRSISIIRLRRGDTVRVGDIRIDTLHPFDRWPASLTVGLNDDSLAVRLRAGRLDAVAPGDIEELGMNACPVPPPDPDAWRLVLLPHHGRASRSLSRWIAGTRPDGLLASSTGSSCEAVEQWSRRVPTVLTSEHGDIRWRPVGDAWTFEVTGVRWRSFPVWSSFVPSER